MKNIIYFLIIIVIVLIPINVISSLNIQKNIMHQNRIILVNDKSIEEFVFKKMIDYKGERNDTILPLLYKINKFYKKDSNILFFNIPVVSSYAYIGDNNTFCLYIKCKLSLDNIISLHEFYGNSINVAKTELHSGDFDIVVWGKNVNTNFYVSILPDRNNQGAYIILITNINDDSYIQMM